MKIIQRFKDVYDHIFYMYGKDPKLVWDRKTVQVSKELPKKHRWLSGTLTDGREFTGQVLVVNQTVLVIYTDNRGKVVSFSPESKYGMQYILEYIEELKSYTDQYKAPLLLVGTYVDDKGSLSTGVFTNPQLNISGEVAKYHPKLSVFQNVSAQLLFTEINCWFGRHASEPNMVQLSDRDKLEKHGFDHKLSFRGKH